MVVALDSLKGMCICMKALCQWLESLAQVYNFGLNAIAITISAVYFTKVVKSCLPHAR